MLQRIITDLRERRLWPVVLVLALAIVAVPIVLAKSPPSAPPAPVTVANASPALPTSLPSVSAALVPPHSDLQSVPHDPFIQPPLPRVTSSTPIAGAPVSAGVMPTARAATATAIPSGTTGVAGNSGVAGQPAVTAPLTSLPVHIPTGHAKPAPAGLGSKQTYDVTLASTATDGGLNTIDSLERLSPVPSASQPRLVELGVLTGGQRVLFAVLPGTTLRGPGTCIPGAIDCEVLALGVNQTESLSGPGGPAVDFAVTAITVHDHGTVAAAQRARASTSREGEALLSSAGLTAPSLFSYDLRLGALTDLRNLSAGGE